MKGLIFYFLGIISGELLIWFFAKPGTVFFETIVFHKAIILLMCFIIFTKLISLINLYLNKQ